jgi:hypothetical protein
MRLLLDESIPVDLAKHIVGHEVATVVGEGWTGKSNGELLGLAASRFEVLVSADRNLPYQQNLPRFDVAVLILAAHSNRIADYLPLLPLIEAALAKIEPGKSILVSS